MVRKGKLKQHDMSAAYNLENFTLMDKCLSMRCQNFVCQLCLVPVGAATLIEVQNTTSSNRARIGVATSAMRSKRGHVRAHKSYWAQRLKCSSKNVFNPHPPSFPCHPEAFISRKLDAFVLLRLNVSSILCGFCL